MTINRTRIGEVLNEGDTAILEFFLLREDGTGYTLNADLSTLTLTLFQDDASGTVINSRSAQDVLNTNNVFVDDSGKVSWNLQPGDTDIEGSTASNDTEDHIAQFIWKWDSDSRVGSHEFVYAVKNTSKIA